MEWERTGRVEWREIGLEGQKILLPIAWVEWRRGDDLMWAPNLVHPDQMPAGRSSPYRG